MLSAGESSKNIAKDMGQRVLLVQVRLRVVDASAVEEV
jgi:hypothetical protein